MRLSFLFPEGKIRDLAPGQLVYPPGLLQGFLPFGRQRVEDLAPPSFFQEGFALLLGDQFFPDQEVKGVVEGAVIQGPAGDPAEVFPDRYSVCGVLELPDGKQDQLLIPGQFLNGSSSR